MERSSFAVLVAVNAHQALVLLAAPCSYLILQHLFAMLAGPTAPHAAAPTLSLATAASPSPSLLPIVLARAVTKAASLATALQLPAPNVLLANRSLLASATRPVPSTVSLATAPLA